VLGCPFFDLDQMMEQGEGGTIAQLFTGMGEERFRELEHQYLKKLADLKAAVVATGGGTPCFFNNMEMINQMGTSIFLDLPPREIALRLSEKGIEKRPMLRGKSREEIAYTLEQLRLKRMPFYSQSHMTFHNPDIRFRG
jgi:shikimate kinase